MFKRAINCPYCNAEIVQDWSDYVVSSDSEEREMGDETEHSIECDEFDCPECGKVFSVSGSIWEYPPNTYNCHELNAYAIDD